MYTTNNYALWQHMTSIVCIRDTIMAYYSENNDYGGDRK